MNEQERGFNPIDWAKDKIEWTKEKAEALEKSIERKIRITLAVETADTALSRLKDLDPTNAALYADLQAELAARK